MKRFLAMILSVVLFSLCGCSERMAAPDEPPAPSPSGSISTSAPADFPERSASDRITADLGNNITVDAQITQPDGGTSLGIYQTEPFVFDKETACKVLLGDGWKINDAIPPAEGIEYFINGEKQLFVYGGGRDGINLSANDSASITSIYDIIPTDPAEPDFMTAGEAAKLAQNTLASLGLETQILRCTPLTGDTISALAEAFRTQFGGDPAEYENCPPCYVIDLCQAVDGVPLCNTDIQLTHGGIDIPSAFAAQPNIQAVVTAEGLYELSATACIQQGAQVQVGLDTISAEKVIGLLQKEYEDVINTSPISIRSIALRYAALPVSLKEQTRQLCPVWVAEGTEMMRFESKRKNDNDIDLTRDLVLYFDAVTGQPVEEIYR